MSGYKSHGSKHGRDKDRDRDREADGDRDRHHHSRDRGESRGRDGSRDGRDRDYKSKHGESRDGRGVPSSQGTPTKPAGGPPAAAAAAAAGGAAAGATAGKPGAAGRGVLGSSFLSSSVLEAAKAEAAKRKAAEAAAAAAAAGRDSDDAEPGEVGGPQRKKPKHEPIVWHSPAQQGGDRPASQQETLQERLQREASEFRQQQHSQDPPRPTSRQRPGSRAGRSPSSSPDSRGRPPSRSPAAAAAAAGGSRRQRRRSHSSDRSRSRSSSRSGDGRKGGGAPKGRWQQQEEEEEEQQKQQQKQRSRWAAEEEEEEEEERKAGGGGGDDVEEGEAVGAAIDEELEELNRRERAGLDAGSDGEASPGGEGGSDEAELLRHEGLDLHHNMLEESNKVEEYEKLNRISEGTYGIVFRARHKSSGKIYALKKLKMEHCPDGFPQTSVREVNVLLSLHHPNIVNVAEVVVGGRDGIFMVMEYVEHDLKYVMELQKAKKAQQFSIGQIKCLMQQLLEGVAFLHHRWVIHRDLKTSNLLYSNNGQLKICDFGLARQFGDPLSPYTPMVVTLWYRAIERLLGDAQYETALDMWSVGCIMGELLLGEPLFQGKSELDQMKKIFALLGTPTQESWPGWDQLQYAKGLQWKLAESQLRSKFPTVFFGGSAPVLSDAGFDLLSKLLEMNPANRITAEEALKHRWFQEAPRPVNPALMPSFLPRHQQSSAADGYRDKLHRPSPGAVGPAGFKM